MTEEKHPPRVRTILASWQAWFVIALLGVIAAVVLGYYNLQRTIDDENARVDAAYVSCVESIPFLEKLSQHVAGVNEVIGVRGVYVQNSKAIVDATSKTDPQRATRKANLARARAGAHDVSAATRLPVPTAKQCLARARATVHRTPPPERKP